MANDNSQRLLVQRFTCDAAAAAAAAALVSPAITIIDRSIIETASGRFGSIQSALSSSLLSLLRRPDKFLTSRPCRLIFLLYFGTYATANSIDTISSLLRRSQSISTVTAGPEKFVATSTVNMGLCLYKDRTFARLFGTGPPRPVPLPSYALFAARDMLTIFCSFNVPPLIAPYMPKTNMATQQSSAQFLAPAACQLLSTPLHLLGLNLYNTPVANGGWKERWAAVRKGWLPSALARMGRIVPAFGVGGVVNANTRSTLMKKIDGNGGITGMERPQFPARNVLALEEKPVGEDCQRK